MGLREWRFKRGPVGRIARHVAEAWKKLSEANPGMTTRDIAEHIANEITYADAAVPDVVDQVLGLLPHDVDPITLSWTIFAVMLANEGQWEVLNHQRYWIRIMREEISKCGVEPGESFRDEDFLDDE